jgi:uncharacterized membrane protein (DUF373 family)
VNEEPSRSGLRIRGHPLRERGPHIGFLRLAEDLVHYAVAVVLMVVAVIVLYKTAYDLANTHFPKIVPSATTAVNGVLFAIIVMEVMRTVVAHFEQGGLQLQPFLIIGIISAVRGILTVGARLSQDSSTSMIHTALLELGVNAAVVVGLAGALVLIRRVARMSPDFSDGS